MSSRSWFWGRSSNPHSLERLKVLHSVLQKNRTVTSGNKATVVEALRSISEILIWGDQNDSSVFEFFLEKNMFLFFINLLNSEPGNHVCIQLLQTLNILFENLRHETSLFYLLSNNHVNSILTTKYDFEDEELLAYYISFLKTLSLRLDSNTVHFFFNEHRADFPLFTEALNFHSHPESMVRAAVRTLTLSVYRVREPSLERFILERTAKPYFSQLIYDCQQIAISVDTQHETGQVELELLNEHLDFLHYFADIIVNSPHQLSTLLIELLLQKLFSVYASPIFKDIAVNPSFAERRSQFAPAVSLILMAEVMSILQIPGMDKLRTELGEWVCSQSISSSGFMAKPADLQQQLYAQREIAIRELTINKSTSQHQPVDSNENDKFFDARSTPEKSVEPESNSFPLMNSCLTALEFGINYLNVLPTLIFLNSMFINLPEVSRAILTSEMANQSNPANSPTGQYLDGLVTRLIQLVSKATQKPSTIRLISAQISCKLFEWLHINLADRIDLKSKIMPIIKELKEQLSIPLRQEELFLEVFEDEWKNLSRLPKLGQLLADTSCISEISQTPMSGLPLFKRIPCGVDEQLRYDILLFFLLRRLSLTLNEETESELPLAAPMQLQKIGSKLDLNNSDLIGCTVKRENEPAERRFLVVDIYQLILVQPDSSRLGWGVVTFSGPLQDLEIEQSSRDNRALSIRIRTSGRRVNQITQLLIFDDHIRSLAARQRLTKGRLRARHLKLQKIAAVLDLPANFLQDPFASSSTSYNHSSSNPIKGASTAGSSVARRPGHAKMSQIFHYGVIDQQPEKQSTSDTPDRENEQIHPPDTSVEDEVSENNTFTV